MDNDVETIHEMREQHPEMRWDIEDVTAMSYKNGGFDAVLDKSLLDFLIYTHRQHCDTFSMLHECARVVQEGGTCIFLSWCPPKEMRVHMAGCPWEVITTQLEAPCDSEGRVASDAKVPCCELCVMLHETDA